MINGLFSVFVLLISSTKILSYLRICCFNGILVYIIFFFLTEYLGLTIPCII